MPQLVYRRLRLVDQTFEFGPRGTFVGLSFTSAIANTGHGGRPRLRTKDQDFILGKRLYIMTSFDKDFHRSEVVESHLGYVCVECKTNLDKTMFQEAVATSRDLKIAVPSSLYFLVCEFLDMAPVSITSTQAVAGFRLSESLAWGKYLYVDDLVSRVTVRSRGYGQELLKWLIALARDHKCEALHLDSGVQNFAAHRFYLRNRMIIASHHFKLPLREG